MSETLSELERHLRDLQPEQLIILLTQIVQKHPSLHGEIEQMVAHILKRVTEPEGLEVISKRTGQRLEPGTHEASVASARLDLVPYRTRLAHYVTRFEQGENEEALAEDFAGLLQEAQEYTDRDAYLSALDLYGVAFDGRLALPEQLKSLEPLLDQILIDA